jgi:glutaredoxin 3
MKKSSSTTSTASSRKQRDYDGRVFIFTTKKHYKDQCQTAKTIISEMDMDASEIKIDDKPYLYEIMTKLSHGRSELPQIFFNEKYIGGLEELQRMKDDGTLKTAIEEVKKASDPGPLHKVYRNQNELFTISPSDLFFPRM